jgi:hypothetical protein
MPLRGCIFDTYGILKQVQDDDRAMWSAGILFPRHVQMTSLRHAISQIQID